MLTMKATTTEDALSPFKKVISNLKDVIQIQGNRREIANAELVSAREQFERTATTKEKQIATADSEAEKAAKILAKLETLFAED